MANQTRFEVVRTEAVEPDQTFLGSIHEAEHKVKLEPKALSWWQAGKVVGAVMDVLAIVLSCTFFVYALAVRMHQNMPMDSPQVKLLLRVSTLGPTIYPILFAAIIGRALKSIAFWKLERGGRIGTLDRLLGSMTIVQTVLTQIQTRSLSLLGLLLIAIWSLSPLGGQASLRVISSATQSSNITRLLQYINTSSDPLNDEYAGGDTASQFVPVNVLFGAALLGPGSSSVASVDSYGNMKVPWIENLDPSTADAQGWYTIPQLNSSDDFTSLIGVPLSMVSDANNMTTSFSIETSYWNLSCPVFEHLNYQYFTASPDDPVQAKLQAQFEQFEDTSQGTKLYNTTFGPPNLYLYSVNMHDASEPWDSQVNTRLRHVTYLDNNNKIAGWTAANCTIKTKYVELSASCSSGTCTAVKIRDSRESYAPESWMPFDVTAFSFYWFAVHFAQALAAGHSVTASPYQKFILDPLNPFNESYQTPPVTSVSSATFALRLGQLLNTYWMAMLAPTAIPKGLRNINITADTAVIPGTTLSSATATETRYTLVLKHNAIWFLILLLSSAATAFVGICGLLASLCRLGPDIGFNVSSLVKDSPFVDQESVATTLGSTDRSILMKDWYAKLGDVAADDEAGYIAIGSGNVADLQRGRMYR